VLVVHSEPCRQHDVEPLGTAHDQVLSVGHRLGPSIQVALVPQGLSGWAGAGLRGPGQIRNLIGPAAGAIVAPSDQLWIRMEVVPANLLSILDPWPCRRPRPRVPTSGADTVSFLS
jgi:hypothetical protein